MDPSRNYYRDLLSKVPDSQEQLKANYRVIVRRTHADANNGNHEFQSLFQSAVEAWKVLGDPDCRDQWEDARRDWLASQNAIMCEGCGEGLRLHPEKKKQNCPLCKTPLEVESEIRHTPASKVLHPLYESGSRLGERIIEVSEEEAERLGRELLQQGAEMLSASIFKGFEALRNKIGTRRIVRHGK